MALLKRLTRLLRADLHAVLDSIEDPAVQLSQAVREMADNYDEAEQRLRDLDSERAQLSALSAQYDAELAELEAELELCLDTDREDIARTVLRRRLELAAQHKTRQAQLGELQVEREELTQRQQQNRPRLEFMRHQLERLSDRHRARQAQPGDCSPRISDEAIDLALLREQQRRSRQ